MSYRAAPRPIALASLVLLLGAFLWATLASVLVVMTFAPKAYAQG